MEFISDIFSFTTVQKHTRIKTFENQVYEVICTDATYFLKIFDSVDQAKLGEKVASLYPFLEQKGLLVPKVIYFSQFKDSQYLILSQANGTELRHVLLKMTDGEKETFYFDFGRNVALLHSITNSQFGDTTDGKNALPFLESNNKGPFSDWKSMHTEMIQYRLSILEHGYFDTLVNPIQNWFAQNSYLISYDITPRLLHIDLNQKNIFVKDSKVSGFIDCDGAFFGHSEEELMRIEGAHFTHEPKMRNVFLKGYESVL